MKFVNSKIKLNIPKLTQLSKAATTALEETTKALLLEVREDQVMPRKEGELQGNKTSPDYSESKKGKSGLNTEGPYARRLYYHPEFNFNRDENRNAKGKWYEEYISGSKKDFCSKTFSKLYKKEAGL